MQRDFVSMGAVFKSISEKAHQQAKRDTSGFTESVHQFLDLIISYEDLCDRREAVVRRHQKALAKVKTMVKHKERIESTGGHMVRGKDGAMFINSLSLSLSLSLPPPIHAHFLSINTLDGKRRQHNY